MSNRTRLRLVLLIALGLLAPACGKKGPLYLPDASASDPSALTSYVH